jgi:hypothetical protein
VAIADDDEVELIPLDKDEAVLGSVTIVGGGIVADLLALALDEDTGTVEDVEGGLGNVTTVLTTGAVAVTELAAGLLGMALEGVVGYGAVIVVTISLAELVASTELIVPDTG